MTSTSEGISNLGDSGGVKNEEGTESDADLIWEPGVDGLGEDAKEDPRFKAYSLLTYMRNMDLSVENGLEFAKLPHRRLGHESSSLDSGDLKVGKEYSSKDGFFLIVKRYSTKNRFDYTSSYCKAWITKHKVLGICIMGGMRHTMICGSGVRYFTGSSEIGSRDDRKYITTYGENES
ncbi:hypothetical protein J1N35_025264 [Gossypium stocksii]|uniref:Uncharacterized protein n=1 Tax=Gossypium stocksii TaxID=47602 RepID=A0A9D3V797_9ROSI|nr:hypothetical protein J1N35_025264 [Gossypium stocksii]